MDDETLADDETTADDDTAGDVETVAAADHGSDPAMDKES